MDQGGTALKLPLNLEMHISVHYNREPAQLEPQKRNDSLLMNSSLDYRLLPNLKVGLNAYLYRPDAGDNLSLRGPSATGSWAWAPASNTTWGAGASC